jgi:hypothetical protein
MLAIVIIATRFLLSQCPSGANNSIEEERTLANCRITGGDTISLSANYLIIERTEFVSFQVAAMMLASTGSIIMAVVIFRAFSLTRQRGYAIEVGLVREFRMTQVSFVDIEGGAVDATQGILPEVREMFSICGVTCESLSQLTGLYLFSIDFASIFVEEIYIANCVCRSGFYLSGRGSRTVPVLRALVATNVTTTVEALIWGLVTDSYLVIDDSVMRNTKTRFVGANFALFLENTLVTCDPGSSGSMVAHSGQLSVIRCTFHGGSVGAEATSSLSQVFICSSIFRHAGTAIKADRPIIETASCAFEAYTVNAIESTRKDSVVRIYGCEFRESGVVAVKYRGETNVSASCCAASRSIALTGSGSITVGPDCCFGAEESGCTCDGAWIASDTLCTPMPRPAATRVPIIVLCSALLADTAMFAPTSIITSLPSARLRGFSTNKLPDSDKFTGTLLLPLTGRSDLSPTALFTGSLQSPLQEESLAARIEDSRGQFHSGAIIGGIVAGIIVIALLTLFLLVFRRKRADVTDAKAEALTDTFESVTAADGNDTYVTQFGLSDGEDEVGS